MPTATARASSATRSSPRPARTTGTAINAQATVVFDTNWPISTQSIVNTIDTAVPTSSVAPCRRPRPARASRSRGRALDGAGSGIASFDVFVSDDGGPFQPFLTGTTATSATFTGQVGHTYSFYSVATSNVGLIQPPPSTTAQATTAVVASSPTPTPTPPPTRTPTPTPTPPPVAVTAVGEVKNKHHQLTEIVVDFSGPLDAAERSSPTDTC